MAGQRITPMCYDWMAIPHQKLYDDIHAGTGTAAVEAAQDFYQQLQRGYLNVMAKLQDGLTRLAEAHQGQAADAGQGAVSVFGDWVDEAAGVAGDGETGVASFSTSFASAKNAMPEPVQVTTVDSTWDNIKDFFGGTTAREAQERAAREAHIEAARVMATFSDSGTDAANGMPYWAPPQQVAFDVPVPPPGAPGGIAEGGGGVPSVPGGGPVGSSGGSAPGGTVGSVSAVPQVTDPASVTPAPTTGTGPAGGGSAVPTAPAAGTGAGAGGVSPGGGTVLPVSGGDGRRGGAGGAGSGLAAGAPQFGTGARGTTGGGRVGGGVGGRFGGNAGGPAGGGRVGGSGGSGGLRPGGSIGAAPGGPGSAAAAAGRGTGAGAAGRTGAGMVPFGAGGGRGQGGEDSEHQRKVPIHGEKELFADDRKTAPPVIGEGPPK